MRPTTSLAIKFRKLKLTTKDVNKGYYKGNRTGSMGSHTRWGGYKVDWSKVRTYPVPSLKDFELTPFVAKTVKRVYGQYEGIPQGPRNAKVYLERWKSENAYD